MVKPIGIMGAGTLGCALGARLIAGGRSVVFVGREALGAELRAQGLSLSDRTGSVIEVEPRQVSWSTTPRALAKADPILVTVKAWATGSVARELEPALAADATVISFQNGVANGACLRAALRPRRVCEGMVQFNVVRQGPGRFHQGTRGKIAVSSDTPDTVVEGLQASGLTVERRSDMTAVLWGKLLFNLNNGLNALCGLPLAEQLSDRRFRLLLASAIGEGLSVLRAAGIRPARVGRLRPRYAKRFLLAPDWAFRLVLARAVDSRARSSMWQDLQRGRRTEVDLINGEVVRLGRSLGVPTPVNTAILEAVKRVEAGAALPRERIFDCLNLGSGRSA